MALGTTCSSIGDRHSARAGLVSIVAMLWLAVGGSPVPTAAATTPQQIRPARQDTPPIEGRYLAPTTRQLEDDQWYAVQLARATYLWRDGDGDGAAALLEQIDISPGTSFPEADRAAFLLALVRLRSGDPAGCREIAARVDPGSDSPYAPWLAYLGLLAAHQEDAAPGQGNAQPGAVAPVLEASLLLSAGDPSAAFTVLESAEAAGPLTGVHLYLQALSARESGVDPQPFWRRLAGLDAADPPTVDLVATALLELARDRLGAGKDADEYLSRVPDASRLAPRARHLQALAALARGDTLMAENYLSGIAFDRPDYAGSRPVRLELGALAGARGLWAEAVEFHTQAEASWIRDDTELAAWLAAVDDGALWDMWERNDRWQHELRMVTDAIDASLSTLTDQSLDLRRRSATGLPALGLPASSADNSGTAALRFAPEPDQWRSLRAVQGRYSAAAASWSRADAHVERRRLEIQRHLSYFDRGMAGAADIAGAAEVAIGDLDTLLQRLDGLLAKLHAVRDRALSRFADRTIAMATELRRMLLFSRAMHHFHVEGPEDATAEPLPEGVPSPAELLALEIALGEEIGAFLELFSERTPDLIATSFKEIWEPRVAGDSHRLRAAFVAERDRARAAGVGMEALRAAYAEDAELAGALTDRSRAAALTDSLEAEEATLRRSIVAAVARRGRRELADEREGIDHHLADAAYWLAIQRATDPATAEDDSILAATRNAALARLGTFHERYPRSSQRSDVMFRLADLRLLAARSAFEKRMAGFLGESPASQDLADRSLAPFVDYDPAIALYRDILDTDPDYAHIDAVLFHLGMILADDGRPDATAYLERLVREYPLFPGVQEAWLRLGDEKFERKDYAGCLPYFEQAALLEDQELASIALYKLGWARFEEDLFIEAADAFRRLLDAAAPALNGDPPAGKTDLRGEAEGYLVHALVRAGGAESFAAFFDRLGGRPYESRVLSAMGHLLHRYSLYAEAVACDTMWLDRYPNEASALGVARHLVDSHERGHRADDALAARLALAPRFLPGGDWFEANTDAEMRREAQDFSRVAYRRAALTEHHAARENDDPVRWRRALEHYETYLRQWPEDGDAPRMDYQAGEAASRLGEHAAAVSHFTAAAGSDTASFAADASWQVVAVTDAWYRRTQPETDGEGHDAGAGADSLATRVLAAGDAFLSRYPDDPHAADVTWRQGNLAYAHGWYIDAAARLDAFSHRYADDARTTTAAKLSGDALYRVPDFAAAGAAYEHAAVVARTADRDSLADELDRIVPLCAYKHAETVAGDDSTAGNAASAELFVGVAARWPDFEHAALALYRAGLGYQAAGRIAEAAGAWDRLLNTYPDSEFGRDAAVQTARALEQNHDNAGAADAYRRFADLYPDDVDAPEALLRAIDLQVAGGDATAADVARSLYMERYPDDVATALMFREARAETVLAAVAGGQMSVAAALATASDGRESELQAYLDLAAAHPEQASPRILAQVDFHQAETAFGAYRDLALRQPLAPAIAAKQAALENVVALYNTCAGRGDAELARASAFRIGEAIVHFGDALLDSERPGDLGGDDLLAYDEVLAEQSWTFSERGEEAWTQMLKQADRAAGDPGQWLARTETALWPRLARRFVHRPEVDYPEVVATPPIGPGTQAVESAP